MCSKTNVRSTVLSTVLLCFCSSTYSHVASYHVAKVTSVLEYLQWVCASLFQRSNGLNRAYVAPGGVLHS